MARACGRSRPELPLAPTEAPAAPPRQIPETMPSPDEAMAFLQSLTVGKEEELRAFAESEGERRMDAIMGGKPAHRLCDRDRPRRPSKLAEPPPAPAEAVPLRSKRRRSSRLLNCPRQSLSLHQAPSKPWPCCRA